MKAPRACGTAAAPPQVLGDLRRSTSRPARRNAWARSAKWPRQRVPGPMRTKIAGTNSPRRGKGSPARTAVNPPYLGGRTRSFVTSGTRLATSRGTNNSPPRRCPQIWRSEVDWLILNPGAVRCGPASAGARQPDARSGNKRRSTVAEQALPPAARCSAAPCLRGAGFANLAIRGQLLAISCQRQFGHYPTGHRRKSSRSSR